MYPLLSLFDTIQLSFFEIPLQRYTLQAKKEVDFKLDLARIWLSLEKFCMHLVEDDEGKLGQEWKFSA